MATSRKHYDRRILAFSTRKHAYARGFAQAGGLGFAPVFPALRLERRIRLRCGFDHRAGGVFVPWDRGPPAWAYGPTAAHHLREPGTDLRRREFRRGSHRKPSIRPFRISPERRTLCSPMSSLKSYSCTERTRAVWRSEPSNSTAKSCQ